MNNNINLIMDLIIKFLKFKKIIDISIIEKINITKPRIKNHGHLSSNIAFLLANILQDKPINIANELKDYILQVNKNAFKKIDIINGFINFFIASSFATKVIHDVLTLKDNFGKSKKKNFSYNLEMISANPTGPLHLGHGRNAFIANSVADILKFAGNNVIKEYYVNDAGNQINNLATTVYFHYLKFCKKITITPFPKQCYQGEVYIKLAKQLYEKYNNKYATSKIINNKIGDEKINKLFRTFSVNFFFNNIKTELKDIDIKIDHFIFESKFYENGLIDKIVQTFIAKKYAYKKDGALWINTQKFGDEKDRVLIKSDGSYTYLLPDIAAHYDRIKRSNANKIIDFFGADHHGYIARLLIGLSFMGYKKSLFVIEIIQMVKVINNMQQQKMSKRAGNVIWLKDLIQQFNLSIVKYIFCSKSKSTHINFDMEVLSQNNENNPVFYTQYATARCFSIISNAKNKYNKCTNLDLLNDKKEIEIMIELDLFNKVVEDAAKNFAPYIICDYIQLLSKLFHSYYNAIKILDDNNVELSSQRVRLIQTINQVFKNAYKLIGIEYKQKMY